jgi:23S rRNA pseudouridine1911/1915/1917 synthase
MDIPILYEDENLLVINKPAGIATHPDSHTKDGTVSDWFEKVYPLSKDVGEPLTLPGGEVVKKPGIVHRLDRDTSGVMMLVKTQEAHAYIKEALQEHEVRKKYIAFVYGTFKEEKKGVIDFPIGRSRKDFRLRSAQPKAKGKMRDAITKWEVIGEDATHSLLMTEPLTGRTHQIRVHLKAIHHPIVCDPLYAPNHPCDLGLSRLALHAYSLDLPLLNGERVTVTAPLPEEMAKAAHALGWGQEG